VAQAPIKRQVLSVMKFGSTVLFVENVQSVMEFYKKAFGMVESHV
jgi:hypothetical protein